MDYLSTFIQMLQTKKFSKNTIRAYVSYMKPYLSYLEKIQISPEQASYQNMRDFLDYIQSERGLSDRTINMIISYLQFFHSARGKKPGEPRRKITLSNEEFIRRFLMHVLPAGFQKIRYYGFLNNRMKKNNLQLIFMIQGHQRFKARYTGMSTAELIKEIWDININICPACGCCHMINLGRTYGSPYFLHFH